MKIMITAVAVEDRIENVDTIEVSGSLWLVPIWADMPDGKQKTPARIVCLSLLPHTKSSGLAHDYVLETPVPKEIFDYEARIGSEVGLITLDPLRLRFPLVRNAN